MDGFRDCTHLILGELDQSLNAVDESEVEEFIRLLLDADKIFFVGVGRVMLSLQSMAKRLAHLGLDCHIVGDITEPAITSGDLLIVGSGSGESKVPVAIAKIAAAHGARIVHLGSNRDSTLAPITAQMVRIPVQTKLYKDDEIASSQVMSSLFEQSLLLLGDAVALMIVRRRDLDLKSLWRCHANLE